MYWSSEPGSPSEVAHKRNKYAPRRTARSDALASDACGSCAAGSVGEDDVEVSMPFRSQLHDAIEVDDGRTVNPDEPLRIEGTFRGAECAAQRVRLLSGMEAHVVSGVLEPVDPPDLHRPFRSPTFPMAWSAVGSCVCRSTTSRLAIGINGAVLPHGTISEYLAAEGPDPAPHR